MDIDFTIMTIYIFLETKYRTSPSLQYFGSKLLNDDHQTWQIAKHDHDINQVIPPMFR